jgi:hypothetical protein
MAPQKVYLAVVAVVLASTVGLVISPSSFGLFARSFVRQITRTGPATGLSCSSEAIRPMACLTPGGVAVDSSGNLWVGSGSHSLSEFNASASFISPTRELEESVTAPDSVSIDHSSGHFYITGSNLENNGGAHVEVFTDTGSGLKLLERWPARFGVSTDIAVDDSQSPFDLSSGSVYVAHGREDPSSPFGDGMPRGIERFGPTGTPISFNGVASYIKGNEITGTPNGSFGFESPRAITVDAEGDIYAVDPTYAVGEKAVLEYNSQGVFVRAFTGFETGGLGQNKEGGFGGELEGVAIDPVSKHVLVSISNYFSDLGAVDEFDSAGRFLNQISETEKEVAPGVRTPSKIGSAFEATVDAGGSLFVVDQRSNTTEEQAVDVYSSGHFLPSFTVAETSERSPASVTLNGSVADEGLSLADCHFDYVTDAAFKATQFENLATGGQVPCAAPSAAEVPADQNYHSVHANISGLTSGTTYRYRIVATTAGILGGTSHSESLAFTAPHPPVVTSSHVTNISSAFADLHATINPLGVATSYQFEYVDEAHYEPGAPDPYAAGATAPLQATDVGSGEPTGSVEAAVVQQISDLTAGTTYHYRVIASNSAGSVFGTGGGSADSVFTTLPHAVGGLPDGRAYEIVTPPDKGGASDMFGTSEVFFNSDVGFPSDAGNEFILTNSLAAFGAFPASEHNAYVFRRDAQHQEWSHTSLASPGLGVQSIMGVVFDPTNFNAIGLNDIVGSASSPSGWKPTSLVGPVGGPYMTLHEDASAHEESEEIERTAVVGASRGLNHIVLESKAHDIAPGDESQDVGSDALYEWTKVGTSECSSTSGTFKARTGGCMSLVNVNSEGNVLNRCGAVLGQGHIPGTRHNAVSSDGTKVVFTAPDPYAINDGAGCWNGGTGKAPQIYMRIGTSTTQISSSEEGWAPEGPVKPAVYVGSADDGTNVFFVTETELTRDDAGHDVGAGAKDMELYEYNSGTNSITRISRAETDAVAAEVSTVPAVSANGAAVYFTAAGRLTATAPTVTGEEVDLYRYDAVSRELTFVATVGRHDYPTTSVSGWGVNPWLGLVAGANWYTTPDGHYLLFATAHELTGYKTSEAEPNDCPVSAFGGGSGLAGHCAEIYLYQYVSGVSAHITCVSCDPTGAPPISNAQFATRSAPIDASGGGVRALSDSGSYAFFDSADALAPQDSNGTLDVYEWHNDAISLVSSGDDAGPSFFLGASANGANVFFGTHARLVQEDDDSAGDLYDARICTEIDPCFKPMQSSTAECEGDACHVPATAPIDTTPVSSSFSGAGNFKSAKIIVSKQQADAQKLKKALAVCRRRHRKRRAECEGQARRRYGKKAKTRTARRYRVVAGGTVR